MIYTIIIKLLQWHWVSSECYNVQVNSSSLVVGKIRRNEVVTDLVKTSPALIQLLVHSLLYLPNKQFIIVVCC